MSDQESLELKNNFARVEWHVDSLQIALDLAGKSQIGMVHPHFKFKPMFHHDINILDYTYL